eukprot:1926911-Amphidinium_carterae.1
MWEGQRCLLKQLLWTLMQVPLMGRKVGSGRHSSDSCVQTYGHKVITPCTCQGGSWWREASGKCHQARRKRPACGPWT